jgi:hypothetical protein
MWQYNAYKYIFTGGCLVAIDFELLVLVNRKLVMSAESVAPLGLESYTPYLRSQGSRPWAILWRPFSGLDGCHPARSPDALLPRAKGEQHNIFAEKRGEEQRPQRERGASSAEWP